MEALGRLMTSALVVVVMLKLLPTVPVETLLMMLLTVMLVLDCKFLLASVVTKELAVRVGKLKVPWGVMLKIVAPLEEATRKIVWAVLVAASTVKAA
jgi:hypothetical protein